MKKWKSYLLGIIAIFIIISGIFISVMSTEFCFNCKPTMLLNKAWKNYEGPVNNQATKILSILNDTLSLQEEKQIFYIFKSSKNINNLINELDTTIHNNLSTLAWMKFKFGESNYRNTTSVVSFIKNGGKALPTRWTQNIESIDSVVYLNKSINYSSARKHLLASNHYTITNTSVRSKVGWFLVTAIKFDTLKLNNNVNKLFRQVAEKTPPVKGNLDNQIFNTVRNVYNIK